MMEKISWKSGAIFPVEAKVAAQTIKDLQKSLGRENISALDLLEASRDENAPLHCCFEWDDTVAAELYRREQARHIISSIEIEYIANARPTVTRLFLNVNPTAPKVQGAFVTVDTALGNDDYRKQVLKTAHRELCAFQRKFSAYEELTGVFKAIDAFADTLK